MLIPKSNLTDYIFDTELKLYKDKKGKTIKMNDNIKAIITAVSYSNQKYSCFGSII